MVLTEIKERVGYIILNRLNKKNALNYEFISIFKKALKEFAEDERVKVLIIKSNSDVFSAGADLEYLISLKNNSYEDNVNDTAHLAELFELIYKFPKITIAQVEGHAIAGGCGIATAADFCYATPNAKFGYTEVKIGFIPALVSVYLLKKIGESNARELLLTGKLITGEEAIKFGIVNAIVEQDRMQEFTFKIAIDLVESTSATSIARTKKLIIELYGKSLDESLAIAIEANATMRETSDFEKGVDAFIDKSKISW